MEQAGVAHRVSQDFPTKYLTCEENQSEVQDRVERKKQQNRARQRAWRERKRAAGKSKTVAVDANASWEGYGMLVATTRHDPATTKTAPNVSSFTNGDGRGKPTCYTRSPAVDHASSTRCKLIPPLLSYATDAAVDQPAQPVVFPLSADHCLITLVQYNVVRAMLLNMSILSLLDCLPIKCRRSFGVSALDDIAPEMIPRDLQRTPIQKSTPHPFWIDAIPFPAMRDNLILLAGTYDSDDLRYDLGQALYEGFDDVERRGCLVWGEPWRMLGWEVSEGFARKWGHLLDGCHDLIESTNHWREARGEDMLFIET